LNGKRTMSMPFVLSKSCMKATFDNEGVM